MSVILLTLTYGDWQRLAVWKIMMIVMLTIDITGGVIANFSYSTNDYYRSNSRARLIFIGIHIQPIILAMIFGEQYLLSISVWVYTVLSAFFVNTLYTFPSQRLIAGVLSVSGITLLLLLAGYASKLFLALLSLYTFKVVFSFAVDHYGTRDS
ncbi:hypothetical protein [Alkalihalobacillus sp. TS-13]|uniref:hypothetical protein n=1 Tax=Alkalihalobacillus sp. TS-13 TaxID=2842455 RepID=UPI0021A98559|nr:hypothetical protein [Alkalihalobacillus sp. TS-13]